MGAATERLGVSRHSCGSVMIQFVVGIVVGGLVSWFITHLYHRKSSINAPEWAKSILERLPADPPSKERLLELFQDALESGDATPDPVLGHVACPECGAPSTEFEHKTHGDDYHTIVVASCPHCGWNDHAEV